MTLIDAVIQKEVREVIGLGNSPRLANLLVKYAADNLFDQIKEVDNMHIHGEESFEGGAVIKHRIHAIVNEVPILTTGSSKWSYSLNSAAKNMSNLRIQRCRNLSDIPK